jgi:uncharacterized membrane protein
MIEGTLHTAAQFASLAIGTVAVLVVAWGAIEAAIGCISLIVRGQTGHGARKVVWRKFGVWLLLGLEFELASDIIDTVISPDWMDIAKLGAIAVIRTFLNYFLEKDLDAAAQEVANEAAVDASEGARRLSAPRAS